MLRRLLAIAFIFAVTSFAWFVLGATVFVRSDLAASRLGPRVESTWGAAHTQRPPSVCVADAAPGASKVERERRHGAAVVSASRIDVQLHFDPRRKGLRWFGAYAVDFSAVYTFRNPGPEAREFVFTVPFPAEQAVLDDLALTLDGRPLDWRPVAGGARASAVLGAEQAGVLAVSYRSRGLDRWRYEFGPNAAPVRDFVLTAKTDFDGFDFPEGTLSPSEKTRSGGDWRLTWRHENLVSGVPIEIAMPVLLQPGPLAGRISFFAPVSLLFFFFVLLILCAVRGVNLHPMNYFFLAAAFFSFHLLLAYMADLLPFKLAFAIAAVVSCFLVVSYLRLVAGLRFAAVEAGLAQLVYLVLFSAAFFFEGATGLAITVGAVVTLFVAMQVTGRVNWSEVFSRPAPAPAPQRP